MCVVEGKVLNSALFPTSLASIAFAPKTTLFLDGPYDLNFPRNSQKLSGVLVSFSNSPKFSSGTGAVCSGAGCFHRCWGCSYFFVITCRIRRSIIVFRKHFQYSYHRFTHIFLLLRSVLHHIIHFAARKKWRETEMKETTELLN